MHRGTLSDLCMNSATVGPPAPRWLTMSTTRRHNSISSTPSQGHASKVSRNLKSKNETALYYSLTLISDSLQRIQFTIHFINEDLEPIQTKFVCIFSATFSHVMVSFEDDQFIPRKRSEFHNLIDFLANSGGLFGLFMGASLLSFIELLYYLTLGMFFARRRSSKIHQAQRQLLFPNRS